jgi:hypothetical protein
MDVDGWSCLIGLDWIGSDLGDHDETNTQKIPYCNFSPNSGKAFMAHRCICWLFCRIL